MRSMLKWYIAIALAALIILAGHNLLKAQSRKPVVITRLYTGPDGQTHAQAIEVKLAGDPVNQVSEMFKVTGAEIHQSPPGYENGWHPASRRQYVITLSGRGEIELAGGQKISMGPGQILLAEDTTGKGHITRVLGNEDRVTVQIPLAEQSPK